jgi:hypothetical protein
MGRTILNGGVVAFALVLLAPAPAWAQCEPAATIYDSDGQPVCIEPGAGCPNGMVPLRIAPDNRLVCGFLRKAGCRADQVEVGRVGTHALCVVPESCGSGFVPIGYTEPGASVRFLTCFPIQEATILEPAPEDVPVADRRTVTISFYEAWDSARQRNFDFNVTQVSLASFCVIADDESDNGFSVWTGGYGLNGSRCLFTLFASRELASGWTFESYTIREKEGCFEDITGVEFTREPVVGSSDLRFEISTWANPLTDCLVYFGTLTLNGPFGHDWHEAFD